MKKIYNNRTKHAIVFGNAVLVPGANVVEEIDENKFPLFEKLVEKGQIEKTDNAVAAINNANTQKIVDDIVDMSPKDEKAKKAAARRKAELDDIDTEAKEAAAEQAKKSSGGDTED